MDPYTQIVTSAVVTALDHHLSPECYPREMCGGTVHRGYQPQPAECRDCGADTLVSPFAGPGGGTWVSHWCGPCSGIVQPRAGYVPKGAYTKWDAYRDQCERSQQQRLINSCLPPQHPATKTPPGLMDFTQPCDGPSDLWCGVIAGRRGTGKRTLAATVGHWYLNRGWRVLYATERDLVDARKMDAPDPRGLDHYTAPDLLILVDLGSEARTVARQEIVRHVLEARYTKRLPTLLTTYVLPSDIPRRWPEWEGVYLRIISGCGGLEAMRCGRLRYLLRTWCYDLGEDVGPPDKWTPPRKEDWG